MTVKKPKKPRVIWVNEYDYGLGFQRYPTKAFARAVGSPNRVRTVKFIEVVPKPRKRGKAE